MKFLIHNEQHQKKIFKNGNYCFEQLAYVHFDGQPYPKEIKVTQWPDRSTGEEPKPYPKGEYQLDQSSFSIGRFGDLICRAVLVPLKKSA